MYQSCTLPYTVHSKLNQTLPTNSSEARMRAISPMTVNLKWHFCLGECWPQDMMSFFFVSLWCLERWNMLLPWFSVQVWKNKLQQILKICIYEIEQDGIWCSYQTIWQEKTMKQDIFWGDKLSTIHDPMNDPNDIIITLVDMERKEWEFDFLPVSWGSLLT